MAFIKKLRTSSPPFFARLLRNGVKQKNVGPIALHFFILFSFISILVPEVLSLES